MKTNIRTSELSVAETLTQIHDLLLRDWSIGNVLNIVQRINNNYGTQINMELSGNNLCYRRRGGSYSIHYQRDIAVRRIAVLVAMALIDVLAGWSDEIHCTVVELKGGRYEVQHSSMVTGMQIGLELGYPTEQVAGVADYIAKTVLAWEFAITGADELGELYRQLNLSLLLEPLK